MPVANTSDGVAVNKKFLGSSLIFMILKPVVLSSVWQHQKQWIIEKLPLCKNTQNNYQVL